jgi:hypothetical protein
MAADFFCEQGHSLGTAHTVTVNSLIESNKQTNKQTNILVRRKRKKGSDRYGSYGLRE